MQLRLDEVAGVLLEAAAHTGCCLSGLLLAGEARLLELASGPHWYGEASAGAPLASGWTLVAAAEALALSGSLMAELVNSGGLGLAAGLGVEV